MLTFPSPRFFVACTAIVAALYAGPVRAENWVVFVRAQGTTVCYDRDSISKDDRGFQHYAWKAGFQSCSDEDAIGLTYEVALDCAQDMTSGDINVYSRIIMMMGKPAPEESAQYHEDAFERGHASWHLARAICGKPSLMPR